MSNLPFFYALENGEFARRGLKIELLPPMLQAPDIVAAVLGGQADGALDTALLSIIQADQRDPGVLRVVLWTIASKDNAFMRIVVPVKSNIHSLNDLRGRRLGHFPSPQLRAICWAIAKRIGAAADAITLQPTPPTAVIEALAAGEIDAALVLEPTGTIAIERGIARSLTDSPVVDLAHDEIPIGAFSLSGAFCTDHPEDARLYVEALEAGVALLRANPRSAPGLIAKYTAAKNPDTAAKVTYPRHWLRREAIADHFDYFMNLLRESGVEVPKLAASDLAYQDQE
ncbi:MAG: ABC transporter substrate-binding protein [Planctomycetes bacterium]|nr:ABC transporter substrate-binding protein [Planctomycetota bacterium]